MAIEVLVRGKLHCDTCKEFIADLVMSTRMWDKLGIEDMKAILITCVKCLNK